MTSSARVSSASGTVRSSVFAVEVDDKLVTGQQCERDGYAECLYGLEVVDQF
jgi:hypothetical protein